MLEATSAFRPFRAPMILLAGLLGLASPRLAGAQEPQQAVPENRPPQAPSDEGVQIVGISASGLLGTVGIPSNITTFRDPFFLGTTESLITQGDIRWAHRGVRSYMTVSSSSVYGFRVEARAETNWNEALSWFLTTSAKRSKWRVSFGGNASVMSFDQGVFNMPLYAKVVAADTTRDQFTSTVLTGDAPDPLLGRPGALNTDTTTEQFAYGFRTATAAAEATVSYAPSSRFGVQVMAGATYLKSLDLPSAFIGLAVPEFRSYGGGATGSYSVTRHHSISAGGTYTETSSLKVITRAMSATASFRTEFRHYWFTEVTGGAGAVRSAAGNDTNALYSGSFGFKSSSHTMIGSFGRQATDSFIVALGPASSYFTVATGAWQWQRPLASWWTAVSVSYYRDTPPAQPHTNTLHTLDTFGFHLGRHYSFTADAAIARIGSRRYIQDGRQYQLSQNSVRLSIRWSPQGDSPRRRR
jgi:hypothetical protein